MGDITKMKQVKKENWIDCLNLLSYWKERDDAIAKYQKKQELINKHR